MSRAERFREKIKLEREIIALVNSNKNENRIRGLSTDAIELWKAKSNFSLSKKDFADKVYRALLDISVKIKVNNTSSRLVFEDDDVTFSILKEKNTLILALEGLYADL